MSTTSAATLAEIAGRRGRTYWLLALGFAQAPDRALFDALIAALGPVNAAEPLAAETAALAAAVQAALSANDESVELAIEFTRLFGGIAESCGGLPPFESVVREGRWGGETVPDLVATYADADVVPPLPAASPVDHLAAELRFLAIACHRESEAWRADNTAAAIEWLRRERDFLDRHLLRWLPRYCDNAESMARTAFYRALLVLTPRACALDRADLDAIMDAVPAVAADA